MVIVQSAECLIEYFRNIRKEKGLKFGLNVKFWILNFFSLKNFKAKICVFCWFRML